MSNLRESTISYHSSLLYYLFVCLTPSPGDHVKVKDLASRALTPSRGAGHSVNTCGMNDCWFRWILTRPWMNNIYYKGTLSFHVPQRSLGIIHSLVSWSQIFMAQGICSTSQTWTWKLRVINLPKVTREVVKPAFDSKAMLLLSHHTSFNECSLLNCFSCLVGKGWSLVGETTKVYAVNFEVSLSCDYRIKGGWTWS